MINTILLIIILAVVIFIAFMILVQGQQIHDLVKRK